MGLVAWIIFGALAGWIASLILRTDEEQGTIGNIIVGIIGALIGGFLSGLLFSELGVTGFNFRSFIIAIAGAIIFLLL